MIEPTPRQREVGTLIAQGSTNGEIAAALGISPKTVDALRQQLYKRLGVHSAVELTHHAIKHQWIEAPRRPRGRPRKQ